MLILRKLACVAFLQVFTTIAFCQDNTARASGAESLGLPPISCALGTDSFSNAIESSSKPIPALAMKPLLAELSSQQPPAKTVTPECAPPPPPTNPAVTVSYQASIPQDHISGPAPTACSPSIGYLYLGDKLSDPMKAGFSSYRAAQLTYLYPNSGTSQNPYSSSGNGDTGYTTQFYLPSPVNGKYITDSDYDGVTNDCYKWTGDGHAIFGQNGNYANLTTSPGSHNIVTNFSGQASNPLQKPSVGGIRWNVSVTVNKTTGNSTHAFVSGSVSCYPSHTVVVNGITAGYYNAPINPSNVYVVNCLAFNGPSTPLQGPGTASGGVSVPVY